MSALKCSALSCGYPERSVLLDIDLEIREGEAVVLLGRNGSGKSTLLKTLSRDIQPLGGTIEFEGKPLEHPELRALFTREHLLASDWYAARLRAKQRVDQQLWQRHVRYAERFVNSANYADEVGRLGIRERLSHSRVMLERVKRPEYLQSLRGTTGAEPAAVG